MLVECKKDLTSKYLLAGLTELRCKYKAASFATRIKMLLVALIIWVLAGPILKPLLVNLYVDYEAARGVPETTPVEFVQHVPQIDEKDIVNIPLELPDVEPIVIDVIPEPQVLNNSSKSKVYTNNKPSEPVTLTETSKKVPENKGIQPFVSPFDIH